MPIIRKFEKKDRQVLRDIVHETALMGRPASLFFEGKEVICDAFSLYFTDYEPESCFVAEVQGQLAGYLIGAKDKKHSEKVFLCRIFLPLLGRAAASGILFKKKNLLFFIRCLKDFFVYGRKTPDVSGEFPATFHLNIKEGYRRQNLGGKLILAYLDYLKEQNIKGVHLATMSDEAAAFFTAQGFGLLYKGKRSYFRQVIGKDVPLYIFGKRLA